MYVNQQERVIGKCAFCHHDIIRNNGYRFINGVLLHDQNCYYLYKQSLVNQKNRNFQSLKLLQK